AAVMARKLTQIGAEKATDVNKCATFNAFASPEGNRRNAYRRLDLAADLGHEIPLEAAGQRVDRRRADRQDDRGHVAARRPRRRRDREGRKALGRALLRGDERVSLSAGGAGRRRGPRRARPGALPPFFHWGGT